MADALVSALASTILGNLNNLALEELGLAGSFKTEMENLSSILSTIHAVLRDAEQKQWKSEAVKNWLRKVKDVACDSDDVLDEFAIEVQRRLPRDLKHRVRSFFSLENPLLFRVNMAHKLKNVRKKLNAIANDRHHFHLREGVVEAQAENLDWRQTSSIVNESEIYGRENEKEQLIDDLDSTELSVHVICGMGGLGKTTLAQMVYNDGKIEKNFDSRIWVCVSDDFDVRRLTMAFIESIEGCPCDIKELDPLQRHLQEKLNGKKFLLILDDVWNEDRDKWDRLKDALRCRDQGSVAVTTTRNEKIALMMATVPIHHMGPLSDDDSWSLFEQRAFTLRRREGYVHLEKIGKEIVKKCGGVPLAIKAMGSLM